METRRPFSLGWNGWRPWAPGVTIAALGLFAYRPLWLTPGTYDTEGALFRPGELPSLAAVALAAWLCWRRRKRLRAVATDRAPIVACALAALGSSLFVWALLTGKADLLLPSLAANGLAWTAATRGTTAMRAALLPALVLLLGVGLPPPLEDEIVWHLQLGTASWAGGLLDLLGRDIVQSGVILRDERHTFHVIDSCSGLNGITILIGVGLIVRELFAQAGRRSWLIVLLAPLLGFPLNVVRVAYVAASPNPEALAGVGGDHTAQGLAVVMAGTAILYALGWALSRGAGPEPHADPNETPATSPPSGGDWRLAAVVLGVLAILSLGISPFREAEPNPTARPIDLPEERAGWSSEPAPHDPFFTGVFPNGLHRRYLTLAGPGRPPLAVDLLVGYVDEASPARSTRLMSSKLLVPGPDWHLVESGRERLWILDREVEVARASRRSGEHALIYAWRPRDRGLWQESVRAWLGLGSSPLQRNEDRAAVRLIAYAPHDGQLVLDRARQRLDRFVRDFRAELDAL